MGNIIDYLKWRGDLVFTESPFNHVDNLILAYLSYLDYTGIAEGRSKEEGISLKEATSRFDWEKQNRNPMVDTQILQILAGTNRFKNLRLWGYEEVIDNKEELTQFAAIHIQLTENAEYISFRGTDNSIVGWREDFRIGFEIVAAQKRAVQYLERTMDRNGPCQYRIGGHSKGGNLALYAAMMSSEPIKEHITEIYMNDSPGLCPSMIEQEQYNRIADKLVKIVPEFSVIGMLFAAGAPDLIVKSRWF